MIVDRWLVFSGLAEVHNEGKSHFQPTASSPYQQNLELHTKTGKKLLSVMFDVWLTDTTVIEKDFFLFILHKVASVNIV